MQSYNIKRGQAGRHGDERREDSDYSKSTQEGLLCGKNTAVPRRRQQTCIHTLVAISIADQRREGPWVGPPPFRFLEGLPKLSSFSGEPLLW
jgi:hypothetical protein